MNKNKLIFAIIAWIIIFLLAVGIFSLNSSGSETQTSTKRWDFKIWILGDSKVAFEDVVSSFKVNNPEYEKKNIIVESFSQLDEYQDALITSIIKNEAPDIFMLRSDQKRSIFEDQTMFLNPEVFNANDFRAKYKSIFSKDLILSTDVDEDGTKKEFLKGLPVGYETLGIFLNRTKGIKVADLESITSMNNIIRNVWDSGKNIIPLGLWNWSTVYDVADIMTQFFMNNTEIWGLWELDGTQIKKGFWEYLFYGDIKWNNRYDNRFVEMKNFRRNNLDLFVSGDIAMVIGFPRMIEEIDQKGFRSFFLLATPFPNNKTTTGQKLAKYNYFVVNKDTTNLDLSTAFLSYLSTDNGAGIYLDNFPYYLPALLSLESDRAGEKIHPDYNVVLKNFYVTDGGLSSFDKGVSTLYDRTIEEILDNPTGFADEMTQLQSTIECKAKKITSGTNLSKQCK